MAESRSTKSIPRRFSGRQAQTGKIKDRGISPNADLLLCENQDVVWELSDKQARQMRDEG